MSTPSCAYPDDRRRGRRFGLRVALWGFAALWLTPAGEAAEKVEPPRPEFVVIVHPKNGSSTLARAFVADAFLKKVTRWGDGDSIKPVDLPAGSSTRRAFSEKVLDRSVAAVRNYWQQKIFSGRDLPPPELGSDEAIVGYVRAHPGAVGYVSGTTPLEQVRVVNVK